MALVIQTNTAAITAQKNINTNTAQQNQALNRLSSGFRINSASDDSAGFAISSKLDATGARLKAAAQNATQAGALVKTAEAGVNEIQNMIVRLQALAVQASSANNSQELNKLDAERTKLTTEIDNIANSTTFNGVNLLNGTGGSASFTSSFTAGTDTSIASATVATAATVAANNNVTYTLTAAANGNTTITSSGTATAFVVNFQSNTTVRATLDDGAQIDVKFGAAAAGSGTASTVAITGQAAFSAQTGGTPADGVTAASITTLAKGGQTYYFSNTAAAGGNTTVTIRNGAATTSSVVGTFTGAVSTATTGVQLSDGNVLSFTTGAAVAPVAASAVAGDNSSVSSGSLGGSTSFQVGAENNADNQVSVNLGNSYTTSALNITGDLTSATNALAYIDTAKAALDTLITQRADLGATQNQLNFVSANLATSIEQITASVSSIRDADIAVEIANFTKSQILVQAGTAMLAQANQASQNVLRLFR